MLNTQAFTLKLIVPARFLLAKYKIKKFLFIPEVKIVWDKEDMKYVVCRLKTLGTEMVRLCNEKPWEVDNRGQVKNERLYINIWTGFRVMGMA